MSASLPSPSTDKLGRYASFVETVLEPSLASLHMTQALLTKELVDYQALLARLLEIQSHGSKPFEMLMDLGSEVFATASVPDPSLLSVDLGLQGIHLQLSIPEGITFTKKREALLKKRLDLIGGRITIVEEQLATVDLAVQEIIVAEGTKAILKSSS